MYLASFSAFWIYVARANEISLLRIYAFEWYIVCRGTFRERGSVVRESTDARRVASTIEQRSGCSSWVPDTHWSEFSLPCIQCKIYMRVLYFYPYRITISWHPMRREYLRAGLLEWPHWIPNFSMVRISINPLSEENWGRHWYSHSRVPLRKLYIPL